MTISSSQPIAIPRHVTPVQASIPRFFVCPISQQLMRDPVTISTGQTFDRCNIEDWLQQGQNVCPVSRQPLLADENPIPNHTLRRLIQGWCLANRPNGIERTPTQKKIATAQQELNLVREISLGSPNLSTMRELNDMAREQAQSRKNMLEAGVLPALASSITRSLVVSNPKSPSKLDKAAEALKILAFLCESENAIMGWNPTLQQLSDIAWLLANDFQSRLNAVRVLNSVQLSSEMKRTLAETHGLLDNLVQMVKDNRCPKALTASLTLLHDLLSVSSNRVRAAEAGAVQAVVESLVGSDRKRAELGLAVLESLSRCAEGRAAFCSHDLSVPITVELTNSISETATELALKIHRAVFTFAAGVRMKRAAVEAGILFGIFRVSQGRNNRGCKKQALHVLKSLGEAVNLSTWYHHNLMCVG